MYSSSFLEEKTIHADHGASEGIFRRGMSLESVVTPSRLRDPRKPPRCQARSPARPGLPRCEGIWVADPWLKGAAVGTAAVADRA
jgi:hypothetical protein